VLCILSLQLSLRRRSAIATSSFSPAEMKLIEESTKYRYGEVWKIQMDPLKGMARA
jgi:hypothetical protein